MEVRVSSKYYNLGVLFLFCSLAFLLVSHVFVRTPDFVVDSSCYLSEINGSYCNFTCSFFPYCDVSNISARVFVAHTGWAGIFDKTFEARCGVNNSYSVILPRRDYRFILRSAFFGGNLIGVSDINYLFC